MTDDELIWDGITKLLVEAVGEATVESLISDQRPAEELSKSFDEKSIVEAGGKMSSLEVLKDANTKTLRNPSAAAMTMFSQGDNVGVYITSRLLCFAIDRARRSPTEATHLRDLVEENVTLFRRIFENKSVDLYWRIYGTCPGLEPLEEVNLCVAEFRQIRSQCERRIHTFGTSGETLCCIEGTVKTQLSWSNERRLLSDRPWLVQRDQAMLTLFVAGVLDSAPLAGEIESPLHKKPSQFGPLPFLLNTKPEKEKIERIAEAISNVPPRFRKELEPGIHRLVLALGSRPTAADAFLDLWIVLENLYGERRGELVFRISTGAARVTESDSDKRKETLDKLKDLYEIRSDIVHGNKRHDEDKLFEGTKYLFQIARTSLRSFLVDHPELASRDKRRDEIFLSDRFNSDQVLNEHC